MMNSFFFQEQRRYSREDLCSSLNCNEENVLSYIKSLEKSGVLKKVKKSEEQKDMSELLYEDIVMDEEDKGSLYYVFTFVGVIVVEDCVFKCYPKYIKNDDEDFIFERLKAILEVIKKIKQKEQEIKMFEEERTASSILPLFLFLLDDYFCNGLYESDRYIIEMNGEGEILWDRTIDETSALVSKNRPYYVNLKTRKRVTNEENYFRLLHKSVLTAVSRELKELNLLALFGLSEIDLTNVAVSDFGEEEYILYRLEKEMRCQFNTRKQLVLKAMRAYVLQKGSLFDEDCVSLYGTNSFCHVWEKVCADIIGNQFGKKLEELPISLSHEYSKNKNLSLKDIIEKPLWTFTEERAENTFIPDIITIQGKKFFIFDAKYYTPYLEKGKTPKDQPGIEDVAKQYFYQMAYKFFIKQHNLEVKNCFLFPKESSESERTCKGEVKMKMFSGLENIKVCFLDAEKAYSFYLLGKRLDIKELKL